MKITQKKKKKLEQSRLIYATFQDEMCVPGFGRLVTKGIKAISSCILSRVKMSAFSDSLLSAGKTVTDR